MKLYAINLHEIKDFIENLQLILNIPKALSGTVYVEDE